MEKKKVAILLPWLKMGGTNKIALNFMKELSRFCDVTLILNEHTGELLPQLPDDIHLVVDRMRPFREIFMEDLRRLRMVRLVRDVIYYGKIRLGNDTVDNFRYLVSRHGYICDTKFDCAIAYHGQSPALLLNLLYRVHAVKKAAWIHGEFPNSPDHCCRMEKYYRKLEHLFFVSNHTMESFFGQMSADPARCSVYRNPISRQEILSKAALPCPVPFTSECVNLLTVGRLSPEKGQELIPFVTRNLLDAGYHVRWYLIGDGIMWDRIEELITEQDVSAHVILLGTRTNPYCFMNACDIYIQPSYTEGYSTTICEAGILGKAIVGTKPSGGIRDQITDGEDGLIVDATVEGLFDGIRRLLGDEALRHRFEANILNKNFEGTGEIHKFLAFLNDERNDEHQNSQISVH